MGRTKIIVIGIALLAVALLYTPLVQFLASPLVVKDRLEKTDAVVVLSGGWEAKGQLGQSTLERYNYGVRLFQQGYGKYLILSGGNLRGEPAEAEAMAEMALSAGFPDELIIVEASSESTWENALFVKKILIENQLESVLLVTSPYHTRRAKTMFEDKGIKTVAAPVPDGEFYTADGTERLRILKLVALEYLKLGLYKVGIK